MKSNTTIPLGAIVMFKKDVTEHRKMEEKLRKSEERLRDFLDNASDLIQIVDSEGRFIYANKRGVVNSFHIHSQNR